MNRKMASHAHDDRLNVNIYEDRDVAYWTDKWGVTRAELTEAVSKVGTSSAAVAARLDRLVA